MQHFSSNHVRHTPLALVGLVEAIDPTYPNMLKSSTRQPTKNDGAYLIVNLSLILLLFNFSLIVNSRTFEIGRAHV